MGRICTECGEYKFYSEFHKHKQCLHGYNTVCKDCRKPRSKAQYKTHTPEYKLWYRAKARAKLKGREFNIVLEDIQIPSVCPIFKVPFEREGPYVPSLDRIDSTKGYVKDNIQVICNRANILKNNATLEELELILEYLKEDM